jgi:curved DNA-binding protein
MAADFYKELGVNRDSSPDDIKKAYRKLAAQLHPDKNPNDKRAESRFKAVNRAYQTLSDPEKRRLYDEFGEDALREGFNEDAVRAYQRAAAGGRARSRPGQRPPFQDVQDFGDFGGAGGGFADLFGDLFSGRARGRGGPRAGVKGSDIASELEVDFVSALRGSELKLRLQDGGDEVTVRIPPGAGEGDRVRVPGHGAPGAFGGPPGDLILTIHVGKHPYFEREGLDLHLDLPITPGEAYHGGKVRVPTPEGPVTLTVPKRAQSGQFARLKGKGVKRQNRQGDLYVRFLIQMPPSESAEIERAVGVLESAMSGDIRAGIYF